jgi:hypothetical protein
MAPDDRDRTFEKALARHLRSSARSSTEANTLAGASTGSPVELCPDPETLAAYHDGSLSPEERNLWKKHVLSCENCQLVLAHLGTTLDIPVHLDNKEEVLALQQTVSSAAAASPVRVARPSPPHNLRWLWLVPAGAIAAGLLVWVSLQEPKRNMVATPPSVEVAENREAAKSPVGALSAKAAPASPRERKEKDDSGALSIGGVAGAASANRDIASQSAQNQLQLTQQAPSQSGAALTHGPSLSMQKQQQEISRPSTGAGTLDLKMKKDAQAPPNINGRAVEPIPQHAQASPAAPPPAPPSEPSFLADESLPPSLDKPQPPQPAAAPKAKTESTDAISAVTESVEVSSAPQTYAASRAMMRAAALQNPHVVWAPGEKQAWRIGVAGSLEHSKDKGLNWTPQISGVYTDLLAGFAASTKVCWIVGASGTILHTTDGGTHWTKLDSPVTNDLTIVRATDAMHASISFVPDLQTGLVVTYQTSDGGHTWFSVPTE